MTLERADFAAFFAEVHDGYRPFAWQERLLDGVLEKGRWPARVVAPTGSGKTAAIDVHVFALALAAAGQAPAPPRRLAMVVDRRVLVDDQYRHAQTLARRFAVAADGESPVLAAMRELLWTLRSPDPERRTAERERSGVSPLVIGRLRGGVPPSRAWRDHPSAAAVICATPDMWGSRLLFRGYGSSPLSWPREAGLLAVDSVVVVDEAHLARQLLCTARRVAELMPVAERGIGAATLQVVETTATPAAGVAVDPVTSVGVDADDLDDDAVLADRLTRPKPVTLLTLPGWEATRLSVTVTSGMADAVVGLLGDAGTVGCFVNTVGRAVGVAAELRRRSIDGRRLRVVMVCGQVRPIDVDRLEIHHPGLLESAGNPDVDVLVSTQSLEVGVDLDLAAMVTELASGSALAQRAGRVNRRGLRPDGPVVVTMPDAAAMTDKLRSGPYGAAELQAAAAWLAGRADDPRGLAPWALRDENRPPVAAPRRVLCQRPELAQAWHWARTSDDLAAEPELELWLTDDFTDDTSVGLVVRDALPEDVSEAVELVRALRPRRHEVFSVPFRTARAALSALRKEASLREEAEVVAVLVRGEDVGPLMWRPGEDRDADEQPRIRPGDQIVLDSTAALFTASTSGFSPPVVVPVDREPGLPERFCAEDVLEAQAELPEEKWVPRRIGGVVHRVELGPSPWDAALVRELVDAEEPLTLEAERAAVVAWLPGRAGRSAMAGEAVALLAESPRRTEVVVQRGADDQPVRVLVIDRRRAAADEELRQVWTPEGREVLLDDHQRAVAARAALLGRGLGLDDDLVEVLTLAGAHHDDGKADTRFQRLLGARGAAVLAKSRVGTTAEQNRRNARNSGLPGGDWRHEQRSVVECWGAVANSPDRRLVARLVGTSHGRGRSGFPHAAAELLPVADATAEWLFDLGGWDDLVEETTRRYGVWGCAYLEAILRAADGQVSEEGR